MSGVGKIVVPRTGFEPVTLGLEVLCSIQLSYQGALVPLHAVIIQV